MKNTFQLKVGLLLSLYLMSIKMSEAQMTDFKMQNYKYRTDGFRAIGLGANGGSFLNAGKASSYSFSLAPSTTFTKQYSMANKQLLLWQRNNLSFGKPVGNTNPFNWLVKTDIEWTKRIYKADKFFEFGSYSLLQVNKGQVASNKSTFYDAAFNPVVGIGKGRLEFVSNSQMALFILEDLKKAGKIKGTVSSDLTYKFTDLITQLYNSRVFDFRVRRNYEVAKIDSFLRQNKIVSATDVSTYNIIADNWNYSIQPSALESTYFYSGTLQVPIENVVSDRINQFGIFGQGNRYAGTRLRFLLDVPSSSSNSLRDLENRSAILNTFDSTIKTRTINVFGTNFMAVWEKHTAIDLHHQQVVSIWASGSKVENRIKTVYNTSRPDTSTKTQTSGMALGGSFQYSLFPNSRTVIATNTQANIQYVQSQKDGLKQAATTNLFVSTFLRASYFLNYRSRIGGQGGIDITPNSKSSLVNFHFTFSYINYLF